LRLLSGRVVKVVKAHYPMGKNIWRVEYLTADGHHKGCLAEWLDQFEEVIPKSYKEQ
jgi:hypothetical protein